MPALTTNTALTSLKLSFGGEIRRFSVAKHGLTYENLMDKALTAFPHLTSFQFSWVDDEDDKVVVSSSEELAEAMRIMATGEKGYLRFEVVTGQVGVSGPTYKATFKDADLSEQFNCAETAVSDSADAAHAHQLSEDAKVSNNNARPNNCNKHSRRGRGGRCSASRNFRGKHCWDRSSVTQAAHNRAKQKAEEDARLEEALIEMCIQDSLDEQKRIAMTAAAAVAAPSPSASDTVSEHTQEVVRASVAQNEVNERACEGQSWASVARGVIDEASKPKTATKPYLRKGQGRQNWNRNSSTGTPDLSVGALRAKIHSDVMEAIPTARLQMREVPSCKEKGFRQSLLGILKSIRQNNKAAVQCEKQGGRLPRTSQESIKWVISGDAHKARGRRRALLEELASVQEKKAEVLSWSRELEILAAMGFSDDSQLLPLLRTYMKAPFSPSTSSLQQQQEGLQAVVLALLESR